MTSNEFDFSPALHATVAILLQIFTGLITGDFIIGGVAGSVFFIAREHTQAEYRWIANFGDGKRANMPCWGGFDCRVWNTPSMLDWLVPAVACAVVWVIAHYLS
ncbi:TPA: hypothetical protein MX298_000855 [Escherichia coli]|nr:hypothetical protein [Escherichia coli]HCA7297234.1 hypothetical protein [Escherichia coli]